MNHFSSLKIYVCRCTYCMYAFYAEKKVEFQSDVKEKKREKIQFQRVLCSSLELTSDGWPCLKYTILTFSVYRKQSANGF